MAHAIFCKMLDGATKTFHVNEATTVHWLRDRLAEEIGSPADTIRMIFGGRQLEVGRGLADYNVGNESTVHVVLTLRGMISTFNATDTSDPLIKWLMLTDEERRAAPRPAVSLLQAAASTHRAKDFQTFKYRESCPDMTAAIMKNLCDFQDYMWSKTSLEAAVGRVDMKLVLTDASFKELTSAEVLNLVKEFWCEIPSTSNNKSDAKVALRMTRSPTNACIGFHCDGGYATGTVQIALSETCQGGDLVFFSGGQTLTVLPRKAGSVAQHPAKVLHAVTKLESGTRKSLFVVDKSNGLGEKDVIEVGTADVDAFIATREERSNGSQAPAEKKRRHG